jgi:diguanylate cyclase (GGDEF)-like protein
VKWLVPLPYVLTVALIVTNYWTKAVYTIDASQHMQYEWGYNAVLLITVAYFATIMVIAAVKYRQTSVASKRRTYRLVIEAMLFIFTCAYVDKMFRYLTILPVAAFGAILFIFVNIQESGINSDKLTLMNNRRKSDDYRSDRLKTVSEDKPMYLYVFDVDSFKQINDRYGHAEGDEALVMTASAIKQTVGKYTGFAARFGGDEFIIIDTGRTRHLEDLIRTAAEEYNRTSGMPYSLGFSIGVIRTDVSERIPMDECIKNADSLMYRIKQKKKSAALGKRPSGKTDEK